MFIGSAMMPNFTVDSVFANHRMYMKILNFPCKTLVIGSNLITREDIGGKLYARAKIRKKATLLLLKQSENSDS